MTNLNVLENKLACLNEHLLLLEEFCKIPLQTLSSDIYKIAALERTLYLSCQASIDIAEALISYKGLPKVPTYREAFVSLKKKGYISIQLSKELEDMTGFRNLLAHEYTSIKIEIVYKILQTKLIFFQEYSKNIKKLIKQS